VALIGGVCRRRRTTATLRPCSRSRSRSPEDCGSIGEPAVEPLSKSVMVEPGPQRASCWKKNRAALGTRKVDRRRPRRQRIFPVLRLTS
jgi:hypothetical protein